MCAPRYNAWAAHTPETSPFIPSSFSLANMDAVLCASPMRGELGAASDCRRSPPLREVLWWPRLGR